MDDRIAARDALLARSRGAGLALTVLTAAVTGGLTGWLAGPEPATAVTAEPVVEPTSVPHPRRTTYLQIRVVPVLPAAAPAAARPPAAPAARAPRRAAPRPPAAPPRRTRTAPVARSDGS